MKKNSWLVILALLLIVSCSKSKNERVVDDPNQGSITIEADESFKSIIDALTDRYMANNPNTKIKVIYKKEDLAFLDLLDAKTRVIVMSRNLSQSEKNAFDQKVALPWEPAKFAADALVFVVPKTNTSIKELSVDDIKRRISSDDKSLIFDGGNGANINFIAQTFNVKASALKYSVINGNENIIDQLEKYPNKIGVVSLNTISRPYGDEAMRLREKINILPITSNGVTYTPTVDNLQDMKYPFTRVLYFLANENYYGLGNGFIRFSCTQLGQMIVEKEGLQPYNMYRREVQMR
ncbi:substrate-binding domain-containing protein [Soonwooa sp.]|uniref:PstS family phosphate ABC transporter substrate-binding protein n=1 Tax=Soonwooa sp. TaxID=1938592 RepID=UPI002608D344|nr:substrate-binding domain-containing protein [Soonwooa sp.]